MEPNESSALTYPETGNRTLISLVNSLSTSTTRQILFRLNLFYSPREVEQTANILLANKKFIFLEHMSYLSKHEKIELWRSADFLLKEILLIMLLKESEYLHNMKPQDTLLYAVFQELKMLGLNLLDVFCHDQLINTLHKALCFFLKTGDFPWIFLLLNLKLNVNKYESTTGFTLLSIIVKEIRRAEKKNDHATAVKFYKILNLFLSYPVSLQQLLINTRVLMNFEFSTDHLLRYFSTDEYIGKDIALMLNKISIFDLDEMKKMLIRYITDNPDFREALKNQYLSEHTTVAELILMVGKETHEIKKTKSYSTYLEIMQKTKVADEILLLNIPHSSSNRSPRYYQEVNRMLSQNNDYKYRVESVLSEQQLKIPGIATLYFLAFSTLPVKDNINIHIQLISILSAQEKVAMLSCLKSIKKGSLKAMKAKLILTVKNDNVGFFRRTLVKGENYNQNTMENSLMSFILKTGKRSFVQMQTKSFSKMQKLIESQIQEDSELRIATFKSI